ncbi:hypothetical protein [Hyphomicrobium sp. CS1GBMeth3]|uniref:hypothetical protein n=1 Tax=Hyphomicrobium sp. CS1GBMeth3 TaxID=1892845 RepID=UPI0009316F6E|nr:hypothetical protein [Hyphomicrobium sp. CS1GBMeth3]
MQLSARLRARISALGELSRPLGEPRAAALARSLANAVAADVARGYDPDATIDDWIRRIAEEIVKHSRASSTAPGKAARMRRIGDVLPEVY